MDIKAVASGGTVPRLAVCYSGDSGPEVACSQPHLIEAVSGWLTTDEDAGARKTRCEALARDDTDRTFDAPDEPLTVAVLMSGGDAAPYRCGVKSPRALTESVWKIGGRQLAAATTP